MRAWPANRRAAVVLSIMPMDRATGLSISLGSRSRLCHAQISEEHRLAYLVGGEDLEILQARFHDN